MAFGDDQIDGYTEGEEPLVFHYKRGDFRKREDKKYSDLATGKVQQKRGLFRVLLSTRANKMLFFVMIVCMIMVLILSFLKKRSNEGSINHINCTLNAFSYDGTVYSSLELAPNKNSPFNEVITINCNFYFIDSDGNKVTEGFDSVTVEFKSKDDEKKYLRFSASDYNIVKVECKIFSGDGNFTDKLDCKVKQN